MAEQQDSLFDVDDGEDGTPDVGDDAHSSGSGVGDDRPATRLTPRAQANLATIVVESNKKAGRETPSWIRELAATRTRQP